MIDGEYHLQRNYDHLNRFVLKYQCCFKITTTITITIMQFVPVFISILTNEFIFLWWKLNFAFETSLASCQSSVHHFFQQCNVFKLYKFLFQWKWNLCSLIHHQKCKFWLLLISYSLVGCEPKVLIFLIVSDLFWSNKSFV